MPRCASSAWCRLGWLGVHEGVGQSPLSHTVTAGARGIAVQLASHTRPGGQPR